MEGECMYLLTIKDGLVSRYIGPYATPQQASKDLQRVLSDCSDRARWQIHALEAPEGQSFAERFRERSQSFIAAAS